MKENEHPMELKETFPDGSQEWACPVCGRRFIIHWPPNYKRVILEEGDQTAVHSGGTGGLNMGAQVQSGQAEDPYKAVQDEANDPYLAPFDKWAEGRDDLK